MIFDVKILFLGVFLRESARTAAKRRTNLSNNSGKATKTAGPIGTKTGTNVQIHLGMDVMPNKWPLETQGSTWGV